MNSSDNDNTEENTDFGSLLAEARKERNFTLEDICEQLKIPVQSLSAIENNDLGALPGPAFTQGYIRSYAKFLEISEDSVLERYSRAVPNADDAKLKPRSNLPGEASSQSPLVKFITVLLVIAGIATVVFGSYQYYQKKADVMETELESKERSFTGGSLDSPAGQHVDIGQNSETGETEPKLATDVPVESGTEIDAENDALAGGEAEENPLESDLAESGFGEPAVTEVASGESEAQLDVLEIYATQGSWVEVRDAGNKRLFYNMVPVRGTKVLQGQAPFKVTMGNARTTRVTINEQVIDLDGIIRPNNTAVFSVSTDDENILLQ